MKRSGPPRPRVKLNPDAVWELLDRLGMSWNKRRAGAMETPPAAITPVPGTAESGTSLSP